MSNILVYYILEHQEPWNLTNVPSHRLNYTLIFGIMREHLQRILMGKGGYIPI
jgi:hypothetical protein